MSGHDHTPGVLAADTGIEDRVWDALDRVMDPEIPVVSVVDMGMARDVRVVDGADVTVTILPTFSGCPAIDVIRQDVAAAIASVEGVDNVHVETSFEPAWTTDRISQRGRRRLKEFGLAPPTGHGPVLITDIGLPAVAECPFCGSRDTVAENPFGPTPCRSVYYCKSCKNPFEQFKPV